MVDCTNFFHVVDHVTQAKNKQARTSIEDYTVVLWSVLAVNEFSQKFLDRAVLVGL